MVYSKQDSDSSISTAKLLLSCFIPFVTLILYVLVHKSFPFSEARDHQVSARVLYEAQSQTDNTIKQVTDAASEMDKPKVMHASDGNAHHRVSFLYELYGPPIESDWFSFASPH